MNFTSDRIIKTVLIVIGINIAVLVLTFFLKLIFSGRNALFTVRKYKFLPIKAVQYCVIVFGGLFAVLSAADVLMPQFSYLDIEDSAILGFTKVHAETNLYETEHIYPLAKIQDNYEKQPDEKVILVLGDSFIWGDGSSNVNVLWWRMLQKRIRDEGFGKCRIVGVGQCYAGTQDQLYWLEHTTMLDDIKPDMIIIGYVTNDAQDYADNHTYIKFSERIFTPSIWAGTANRRWYNNKLLMGFYMLFPNIERSIENTLNERYIAVTEWPVKTLKTTKDGRKIEADNYPYDEWQLKIIEGANLERYNKLAVEPLGNFIKNLSVPCVLMTTPSKASYDYFYARYKDVLPLFRNAGIPVYDCLDDLVMKHSSDIRYNVGISPVNHHPSIPMNKYYADYAFDMIKKYYPDMLGSGNIYSDRNAIVLNDWFPYDDFDPYQEHDEHDDRAYSRKLLNPSVKDNKITFTYSDEWENNKYLYLPMNAQTVKLCFGNTISPEYVIIKNSDGSSCNDFTIWEAHIGSEGFEEFNTEKLSFIGEGKYQIQNENITSLNLHRSSKVHGKKEYIISFE